MGAVACVPSRTRGAAAAGDGLAGKKAVAAWDKGVLLLDDSTVGCCEACFEERQNPSQQHLIGHDDGDCCVEAFLAHSNSGAVIVVACSNCSVTLLAVDDVATMAAAWDNNNLLLQSRDDGPVVFGCKKGPRSGLEARMAFFAAASAFGGRQ